MKMAFFGLMINLLWLGGLSQDYYGFDNAQFVTVATYLCLGFWVVSLAGFMVMLSGKRKLGALLMVIGSMIFVPLGLVAIIGARKATNKDAMASLDERRKLAG